MIERQVRISKLVREQRGINAKPDFLRSISLALNCSLYESDLLDLDTTDNLRNLAGNGYQPAKNNIDLGFARYYSKDAEAYVLALTSCLGKKLTGRKAFALFRQSDVCGGVSIDSFTALASARQLLKVDGDGLTLVAADGCDGFLLDFNPDDEDGYFELVIWGGLWPAFFLTCL